MVVRRKSSNAAPRVILYYRNSHGEQEASIERQESVLEPHAVKQGWNVVARIYDEDISGGETLARPGLQTMLKMIRNGEADGIGIDSNARLLRLNMIKMGALLDPIVDAGVWIEAAKEGRFDPNSMTGRVMMGLNSEVDYGKLLSTARDSLTQQIRLAKDMGEAPLPKPCYGYRRVDDMDKPPRKDRRRYGKWIVHDQEGAIVRQIFKWYAEGETPGWICSELRRRAVPTQSGGTHWHRGSLRAILENEKYIGDAAYGKTSPGKYYHQENGEAVATQGRPDKRRNPRSTWIFSTARVPKIVDRDVWQTVQDRLERGRVKVVRDEDGNVIRRTGEATSPTLDRGAFLLSRLLVCGHCGSWMTGFLRPQGKRENAYVCARYMQHGTAGCVRCEVRETDAVNRLIEELRQLLAADKLAFLREQLHERLSESKRDDRLKSLRRQVTMETAELGRCRQRLIHVSEDMIPEVEEAIRQCRTHLAELQRDIEQEESSNPARDLETALEASTKAVWKLEQAVQGGNRAALREALLGIVEKVVLHSATYTTTAGKVRRRPASSEVTMRKGTGLDTLIMLGMFPTGNMPSMIITLTA